ncbi:cob(I)yrinic acid a,c-diamide adenosyltransferase [Permianibacter sp. IMCC34836]|uniref:cob(I)yrinic acid a,c-diamide adenosyltransferase n=1 Tax=Permianibacter fluminis TaxID=2738515 RepID=UPI001557D551|nr:cob(I)yrinic acid a,c-diamide adenosyltransferase [Permianibacter fluminis]NQD38573.1 cob(I)yrinic acid a,c-diamide adenosyltransferase [Permianibacter fluminis]
MTDESSNQHQRKMQKLKTAVDAGIAAATDDRGLVLLLTGDGKGKTSSAFGMVMRSLGYGHKVGVVQFIKGVQLSGEELYLRQQHPEVHFYQMGTGFTWDTQNRSTDIAAAERTWAVAAELLRDASVQLLVLDELTYMLSFKYLDEAMILAAIRARPPGQTVVITGRGGGSALRELADTVAEVQDIKHAFRAGIMARKGVDF